MKITLDGLVNLTILVFWMMGIVIATGFWSTTASIFFPPWALYLSAEHLMIFFGLI